jgi:hypothetical protein
MLSSTDYHEILRLRRDFDVLYAEWKQILLEYSSRKFSPLQPRKPPGPGGGQWRRCRHAYTQAIQRHCNGWAIGGLLLESDAGRHPPVRLPATRLV